MLFQLLKRHIKLIAIWLNAFVVGDVLILSLHPSHSFNQYLLNGFRVECGVFQAMSLSILMGHELYCAIIGILKTETVPNRIENINSNYV